MRNNPNKSTPRKIIIKLCKTEGGGLLKAAKKNDVFLIENTNQNNRFYVAPQSPEYNGILLLKKICLVNIHHHSYIFLVMKNFKICLSTFQMVKENCQTQNYSILSFRNKREIKVFPDKGKLKESFPSRSNNKECLKVAFGTERK